MTGAGLAATSTRATLAATASAQRGLEISLLGTSLLVLFTLLVIFAASCAMFYMLVYRSTSRRQWVALWEWGKDRGFRFRECPADAPPAPLDALAASHAPRVRVCMSGTRTTLLSAETSPAVADRAAGDAPPKSWNLLVRQIEVAWPPTGLRPSTLAASVLDLFSLTSFPLMGSSERFVVYGTDSVAASALARSAARGLLPPDVGLLVYGGQLVLDFSARPFDAIEFERMIAVAEQVVDHLPVPVAG